MFKIIFDENLLLKQLNKIHILGSAQIYFTLKFHKVFLRVFKLFFMYVY